MHSKPPAYRRCSRRSALLSLRKRGQRGCSASPTHPTPPTSGAHWLAPSRGRSWALESRHRGGRRAVVPGGWTPAPPAAAERSARNLLTGPEQRAANPAGVRGRAGGRRDPAPSPAPASSPRPPSSLRNQPWRRGRGGAAGAPTDLQGATPQSPSGRAG